MTTTDPMTDGHGAPGAVSAAKGQHGGIDRVLATLAVAPAPPVPALPADLELALGALEPVATRRPRRQWLLIAGGSLAYAGALLAAMTVRRDVGELPAAWLVAAGGLWLVGFAWPAYLALAPAPGTMTPRWTHAAIAAGGSAIGFIALGVAIHPSGASSSDYGWDRFARGQGCLALGLAVAVVPVVAGAFALRGALPVGSRRIAACLGAAGGALGGLFLHLHCPIADWQHVALVHGSVVAVAAALSAAIAPVAMAKRFRA